MLCYSRVDCICEYYLKKYKNNIYKPSNTKSPCLTQTYTIRKLFSNMTDKTHSHLGQNGSDLLQRSMLRYQGPICTLFLPSHLPSTLYNNYSRLIPSPSPYLIVHMQLVNAQFTKLKYVLGWNFATAQVENVFHPTKN